MVYEDDYKKISERKRKSCIKEFFEKNNVAKAIGEIEIINALERVANKVKNCDKKITKSDFERGELKLYNDFLSFIYDESLKQDKYYTD